MKSRLNGRNQIKAMNTWAGSVMRCGAGTVRWTKNKLGKSDRKTSKAMSMNQELHSALKVRLIDYKICRIVQFSTGDFMIEARRPDIAV